MFRGQGHRSPQQEFAEVLSSNCAHGIKHEAALIGSRIPRGVRAAVQGHRVRQQVEAIGGDADFGEQASVSSVDRGVVDMRRLRVHERTEGLDAPAAEMFDQALEQVGASVLREVVKLEKDAAALGGHECDGFCQRAVLAHGMIVKMPDIRCAAECFAGCFHHSFGKDAGVGSIRAGGIVNALHDTDLLVGDCSVRRRFACQRNDADIAILQRGHRVLDNARYTAAAQMIMYYGNTHHSVFSVSARIFSDMRAPRSSGAALLLESGAQPVRNGCRAIEIGA